MDQRRHLRRVAASVWPPNTAARNQRTALAREPDGHRFREPREFAKSLQNGLGFAGHIPFAV